MMCVCVCFFWLSCALVLSMHVSVRICSTSGVCCREQWRQLLLSITDVFLLHCCRLRRRRRCRRLYSFSLLSFVLFNLIDWSVNGWSGVPTHIRFIHFNKTHTHTHIHIYIYIYIFVCVHKIDLIRNSPCSTIWMNIDWFNLEYVAWCNKHANKLRLP
jgi:hypothetical protein